MKGKSTMNLFQVYSSVLLNTMESAHNRCLRKSAQQSPGLYLPTESANNMGYGGDIVVPGMENTPIK